MRQCCSFVVSLACAAGVAATFALAQPPADKKPAVKPAEKAPAAAAPKTGQPAAMPPEMEAMMKACTEAATPGQEHATLTKGAGTWDYTMKHWPMPGMTPMESKGVSVNTPVYEGRFLHCESKGEMPGMGMFQGQGFYGYDNTAKEYQCFWFDNMGTGMMTGTGALSADGKTMTWTMHYTCPVMKKQATMREVQHFTSDTQMSMEFFGPDPSTGKEYKMMEMECTRKGAAPVKMTPAAPAGAKPEVKPAGK